jgi:hypothetical protein
VGDLRWIKRYKESFLPVPHIHRSPQLNSILFWHLDKEVHLSNFKFSWCILGDPLLVLTLLQGDGGVAIVAVICVVTFKEGKFATSILWIIPEDRGSKFLRKISNCHMVMKVNFGYPET